MFEAVRRPRLGLEALRFDRLAVDGAASERALVYPTQRVSDLLQLDGICVGFRECLVLAFVGDAGVGCVARILRDLRQRVAVLTRDAIDQRRFEFEQAIFEMLYVHSPGPISNDTRSQGRLLRSNGRSSWRALPPRARTSATMGQAMEQALADSKSGDVVKPILRMST